MSRGFHDNRTPALGYASLTEACVALRAEGLTNPEIAQRIERPPEYVRAWLRRYDDRQIPGHQRTYMLKMKTLQALRPAAQARGISIGALAEKLLDTIARDGLANAILDDDEPPEHEVMRSSDLA